MLNLFYISCPFVKQDYQIYPQYTQMILTYWKYKINELLQFRMISKIYICCNLWFNEFTPRGKFTPG